MKLEPLSDEAIVGLNPNVWVRPEVATTIAHERARAVCAKWPGTHQTPGPRLAGEGVDPVNNQPYLHNPLWEMLRWP